MVFLYIGVVLIVVGDFHSGEGLEIIGRALLDPRTGRVSTTYSTRYIRTHESIEQGGCESVTRHPEKHHHHSGIIVLEGEY